MFYMANSGVAVELTERIWNTPCLNGVMEDVLYLQNFPSMVAVYSLDVFQLMTAITVACRSNQVNVQQHN